MKLQIISKLSQHEHFKIDSLPCYKPQPRENKLPLSNNLLADDIDQYISAILSKRPKQEVKKTSLRSFFNNFEAECRVQYKPVSTHEVNTRRKLQKDLLLLAAKEKENIQRQPISTFTFSERELQKEIQGYDSITTEPCNHKQEYYVSQQRPKQKIRKFNSLISIRSSDQTQEEQRKPGFILKRNVSISKKQNKLQCANEQPSENKVEDSSAKMNRPRRDGHNPKWDGVDKVDEEISQSKERIARIRRQLNQIYQSSKGPNTYKLRLF